MPRRVQRDPVRAETHMSQGIHVGCFKKKLTARIQQSERGTKEFVGVMDVLDRMIECDNIEAVGTPQPVLGGLADSDAPACNSLPCDRIGFDGSNLPATATDAFQPLTATSANVENAPRNRRQVAVLVVYSPTQRRDCADIFTQLCRRCQRRWLTETACAGCRRRSR